MGSMCKQLFTEGKRAGTPAGHFKLLRRLLGEWVGALRPRSYTYHNRA